MQTIDRNLAGYFLLAMPQVDDDCFHRSLVYLCEYKASSAMGFVVNKPLDFTWQSLQSEILDGRSMIGRDDDVLMGGPVVPDEIFILHSNDRLFQKSIPMVAHYVLTSTLEAFETIMTQEVPREAYMFMGYASWSEGQLDREIARNDWLVAPLNFSEVMSWPAAQRYERALASLHITPECLLGEYGNA